MFALIVIGIILALALFVAIASPTARHLIGAIAFEIVAMRFGQFVTSRQNGREELGFWQFVDWYLPAKRAGGEVRILDINTVQKNNEKIPTWETQKTHLRICPNHNSPYIPQLHWVHCDSNGNPDNVLC